MDYRGLVRIMQVHSAPWLYPCVLAWGRAVAPYYEWSTRVQRLFMQGQYDFRKEVKGDGKTRET